MTDSRLPQNWLNNPIMDALSDTAWRVFTGALMWSNGAGTDGLLPTRYLRLLHPEGEQLAAADEIEKAGLWEKVDEGYQFIGWSTTLGQSTAEEVERRREGNRLRVRKHREKEATGSKATDLTEHVTHYVMGHVGQGRAGQDRPGQEASKPAEKFENVDPETGEIVDDKGDPVADWDTVQPGSVTHYVTPYVTNGVTATDAPTPDIPPGLLDYCAVCGGPLSEPALREVAICGKPDSKHDAAKVEAGIDAA